MIMTEKKSARTYTQEFGTICLDEFPRVILTRLIVKKSSWGYQQNDVVFCSTFTSPLVDGEALNVHFLTEVNGRLTTG